MNYFSLYLHLERLRPRSHVQRSRQHDTERRQCWNASDPIDVHSSPDPAALIDENKSNYAVRFEKVRESRSFKMMGGVYGGGRWGRGGGIIDRNGRSAR